MFSFRRFAGLVIITAQFLLEGANASYAQSAVGDEGETIDDRLVDYVREDRTGQWGIELEARATYLTGPGARSYQTGPGWGLAAVTYWTTQLSSLLSVGQSTFKPSKRTTKVQLKKNRILCAARYHISENEFGPAFIELGAGLEQITLDASDHDVLEDDNRTGATLSLGTGVEADFNRNIRWHLLTRYNHAEQKDLAEEYGELGGSKSIHEPTVDVALGLTGFF